MTADDVGEGRTERKDQRRGEDKKDFFFPYRRQSGENEEGEGTTDDEVGGSFPHGYFSSSFTHSPMADDKEGRPPPHHVVVDVGWGGVSQEDGNSPHRSSLVIRPRPSFPHVAAKLAPLSVNMILALAMVGMLAIASRRCCCMLTCGALCTSGLCALLRLLSAIDALPAGRGISKQSSLFKFSKVTRKITMILHCLCTHVYARVCVLV